jgi:hypothetical protein
MSTATEQPLENPPPSATTESAGEVELKLSDVEAGLASLPRAKVARAISLGGGLLVIAMVGYRWYEGRDHVTLALVGAALLALLFLNRNPARKIAKRVYDGLPPDARKIAVTVNDQGLQLRSSGSESELLWSEIWKITQTREVLVVFLSRENAQILPKRALSDANLVRLQELSAQKIRPRSEPFFTPEVVRRLTTLTLVAIVAWCVWFFFGKR